MSGSSSVNTTDAPDAPIPIVLPPPPQFAAPLLQVSTKDTTILPFELVDLMNQVYFFHVLSTEPQKVLPPEKSLLSVLSRSSEHNESDESDAVKERVQNIVRKAFWDEAIESLSNPAPSSQLPRLKRLYDDLYDAISPLLPKGHTVLITLSSPLSPTSSPLLSAITHLRETLSSLRRRCAPVRDQYLDQLLHNLEDIPPASSTDKLATIVVETVKSILSLADAMKDDLSQFVLGSMTERQLMRVIAEQAISLERRLVLDLWKLERVQKLWVNWVREPTRFDPGLLEKTSPAKKWAFRLIQTLTSVIPISCPLPTKSFHAGGAHVDVILDNSEGNVLPPPLFFSTPTLLYVQNYLQALVIAASLQSLVPRSPNNSSQSSEHRTVFMRRIWTLLKAEIDGEPGSGDTKVVNLADEVIQAHRAMVDDTRANIEEQRLRSTVERILHTNDPVFVLLQNRLLAALLPKLVDTTEGSQHRAVIPDRLRSGTARGERIRLELSPQDGEEVELRELDEFVVKGFEDPVLAGAVKDGAIQLKRCIEWTIRVWGDLIEQHAA